MHKILPTTVLSATLVITPLALADQKPVSEPATGATFALPHAAKVDGIPITELSGLAWDADEQLLYAVSDQGYVYQFRVERNGDRLTAIEPLRAARLSDREGAKQRVNAEGLALEHSANGERVDTTLVVALESKPPRIARFSPLGQWLADLSVPGPAADLDNYRKKGSGLESLALHPQHGFITAPEAPLEVAPEDAHTLYAQDGQWSFPRHEPESRLKGLDVLPGGQVLVLERSKGDAKKSRVASVRRVDLDSSPAGNACAAQTIVELPEGSDNFEGVTLLDDAHLLLVSDNGDKHDPETRFVLLPLNGGSVR